MSDIVAAGALDSFLEQLSRCLDPESARRMAELQVDEAVQARVDLLAERANEGLLTAEERSEYEAFINASDLFTTLQLKALRHATSDQA
jgi:hypothetical protein